MVCAVSLPIVPHSCLLKFSVCICLGSCPEESLDKPPQPAGGSGGFPWRCRGDLSVQCLLCYDGTRDHHRLRRCWPMKVQRVWSGFCVLARHTTVWNLFDARQDVLAVTAASVQYEDGTQRGLSPQFVGSIVTIVGLFREIRCAAVSSTQYAAWCHGQHN